MAKRASGTTSFGSGYGTPIAISFGKDEERSDFRQVPNSDTGDGYDDRGQLGSWDPNGGRPYPLAEGVKLEAGFGADRADLERGYIVPGISEDPAYDKENYRERMTIPRDPDEDQGNRQVMDSDWEFRNRNRRAKGFLTRPYIPTER